MVKIIAAHLRQSEKGNFVSLELHGDLEMVQSQKTGRFYATFRKCFVGSTFDEETAKSTVGTTMKGNVVRVETAPYEFTIPDTAEVVLLAHRWEYRPEDLPAKPMEVVSPLQPVQ